ncbi:MAG: translation initiation factor IF-2 subunit gamma [Candidatus Micrarchaeaceae archaeon]
MQAQQSGTYDYGKPFRQSQMNIGTLGHVDHGKTTLTSAITHTWTDTHSESIKRSMTIKLGYADSTIYLCGDPEDESAYATEPCKSGNSKPLRRISILDAPGHEMLMATAIAGSNIIDAALLVIAANEQCPMPQTKEHMMIINALGIKHVIIAQTKIDLVGKAKAQQSYDQIRQFIKGTAAEGAPVIPVMANRGINVDALLKEIAQLPIPHHDTNAEPIMYIARSFDVNKPGTPVGKLIGGVVGGSIIRGKFKVGDEIEISPGVNTSQKKETYEPIITKILSISSGDTLLDEAVAGGLIALGTDLDPSYTKADSLVGQTVGHVGKLPEPSASLSIKYFQLDRQDLPKQSLREGEPLLLGIGTGTFIGYVKRVKKGTAEITLKRPACVEANSKISILRNFGQRWRLSGYAVLA